MTVQASVTGTKAVDYAKASTPVIGYSIAQASNQIAGEVPNSLTALSMLLACYGIGYIANEIIKVHKRNKETRLERTAIELSEK